MKKIAFLITFICLVACSKSKDPLRSENSIISFQLEIGGDVIFGEINQISKTIVFNLIDAEISSLVPIITISEGATINPSQVKLQNFNHEVRYTVTAENGNPNTYTVSVNNKISSSENLITSFQLPINGENIVGEIDQSNNSITFDLVGADVESLTPLVEISKNATVNPSNSSLNFNDDVTYTVTAENGDTRTYTILVNNRELNKDANILSFIVGINGEDIEARIDPVSKEIAFETGSFNISRLVPQISISENATISPASGEAVDFTKPVTYIVTAENGDIDDYTIIINKAFNLRVGTAIGPNSGPRLLYTRAEMEVITNFLDPSLPGVQLFLFDGTNKIELPILDYTTGESRRFISYNIRTKIPENTVTSANYRVGYKLGDFVFESGIEPDSNIDVLAEGAPKISGVDRDSYSIGDTLIVAGDELTPLIGVPSNGSFYLFNPLGSVDTELNPGKTEYRLLLDGSFTRSAFFKYGGDTRDIIFIGPGLRVGEKITVNVNN